MAEENNNLSWPGWKTLRLIGRGNFGAVYEIEREVFGHKEKAALKIITIPKNDSDIDALMNDGYDEASITKRFESYLQDIVHEYNMMAEMKGCSNIVYCDDVKYIQHDRGIGWDIFIKMELLTSLPRALDRTVSDEQVIKIGRDLCSALVYCEKRNVLHRDIKPQNIFVAPDGTYKLGDFGIAKTTERTTRATKVGTFQYMAPEVYNNQPYGPKADLYSLGLVLYWLLNERRTPFLPLPPTMPKHSEEEEARQLRFRGEPLPAPAHGSEELKQIVLKACAFDPKDRYQDAGEMLEALNAIGSGHGGKGGAIAASIDSDEATVRAGGFGEIDEAEDLIEEDKTISSHQEESEEEKTVRKPTETKNTPVKQQKKKWPVLLAGLAAAIALAVTGYFSIHIWEPATCSEPEVCKICGKTRGEALGHSWGEWAVVTDATCTEDGQEERVCENDPSHAETRTIAAKGHKWASATCTEPSICTVCGEQSGGAIGHAWGKVSYTWAEDGSSVTATRICENDPSHVETETVDTTGTVTTEASCETEGVTSYTAVFSNDAFKTQTEAYTNIPAIGHSWSEPMYTWSDDGKSVTATRVCKHDANHVETETVTTTARVSVAASCETDGETTYTAVFTNKAFKTQTASYRDIPATGHSWGEATYTWSTDGKSVSAKRVCAHNANHVETETVQTEGKVTTAATCETKGKTTYMASFSNKGFETQEKTYTDISALGHSWGEPTYTWAADGKSVTAKRVCTHDANHVESETVKTTGKVTKAAACETMGETTYTASFSNTAFRTQTKTLTDIHALGHDWEEVTYSWAADGKSVTAKHICKNDASHVETETVKTTGKVTTKATCETKGKTSYTASFSNKAFPTQTKTFTDIPATGHSWGEPTYTWSSDGKSVTAKRVCKNNSSHVETETVKTTGKVTTAATCEAKGKTSYTASFNNKAFKTQTKAYTNISATGHSWGEPTYTWSSDGKSVTAKRVCKHNASHVETETVKTTGKVTTAATCLAKGQTTYTASFSNKAFKSQSKTYTDIAALGHDWKAATATQPKTCRRCGVTTGDPLSEKVINPGQHWSEKQIALRSKVPYMYSSMILDQDIKKCKSFKMDLRLYNTTGYPYGTWHIYVRNLSGKWHSVDTFKVKKDKNTDGTTVTYTFKFDDPISFDRVWICGPDGNGYSFSYWFNIYDVHVKLN